MTQRQLYSGLDLYDWRGTGPNGRTKAVDVDKWQQNQEDIRHLPGAFPVQSVVITDGQITPTAAALSVDTEGGAPADDLTAIAPGDLHAGMLLALCSVDAGRKVTIKNSAGASGIQTLDGKNVTLDTRYAVMLRLVSTESLPLWREEPGPLRLRLTVSTSDTLGGVKVQTGDDDGLEMIGDKLRARQASATQRGSVLASEAAQAGAVPVGGADGSLGEDWLKKAMDSAAAAQTAAEGAQKTADEAKEAAKKLIVVRAIRNSLGSSKDDIWTITGVDTSAPLFITHKTTKSSGNTGVYANILTGSLDGSPNMGTDQIYVFGNSSPGKINMRGTASMVVRPSNETLTLSLFWLSTDSSLTAWQYV